MEVQPAMYDDSEWTPTETGLLAGEAFSQLDDTDYSEYLTGFGVRQPNAE